MQKVSATTTNTALDFQQDVWRGQKVHPRTGEVVWIVLNFTVLPPMRSA